VSELLAVDREYRQRAAAGALPKVAPSLHNPSSERWLPVMHATRGDRRYTALFSNTATAHRLGRTRDWVLVYAGGGLGDRRYTVVTPSRGVLARRRVVRGRESECIRHYHLSGDAQRRRGSAAGLSAVRNDLVVNA
jgi:hypothetical protein